MLAKIAFASENYFGEREDLVEGTAEDLLLSAAMDYADIHGQEALMNAATDRRAVLGAVLAAGACLSPALWGGASALIADPVLEAIERHRRVYDAFMEVWGQTNVSDLYDRANAEEGAAAELRRFRELETEEAAFASLLATRPATKASAIACVKHVADCGLASDEMRAWLAMMVESPLAS